MHQTTHTPYAGINLTLTYFFSGNTGEGGDDTCLNEETVDLEVLLNPWKELMETRPAINLAIIYNQIKLTDATNYMLEI